jgi:hypothetical protein
MEKSSTLVAGSLHLQGTNSLGVIKQGLQLAQLAVIVRVWSSWSSFEDWSGRALSAIRKSPLPGGQFQLCFFFFFFFFLHFIIFTFTHIGFNSCHWMFLYQTYRSWNPRWVQKRMAQVKGQVRAFILLLFRLQAQIKSLCFYPKHLLSPYYNTLTMPLHNHPRGRSNPWKY